MDVLEGYRVDRVQEMRASVPAEGYVKEFTRHSNDVLLNLNELRHRNILTDTTLVVGSVRLQAHCAVLVACRLVQIQLQSFYSFLYGVMSVLFDWCWNLPSIICDISPF